MKPAAKFGLALLISLLAILWWNGIRSGKDGGSTNLSHSSQQKVLDATASRPLALGRWKSELVTLFENHEAGRCRILGRKQTVESGLILLAVEPPTPAQVEELKLRIDALSSKLSATTHAQRDAMLGELIAEYDPFGDEGKRVIQIDVPDEPNGRLTGFICTVDDFDEITRRFIDGEMTDLKNLRGYSASYAGLPLVRFEKVIARHDN